MSEAERILLIEDDQHIQEFITAALKSEPIKNAIPRPIATTFNSPEV